MRNAIALLFAACAAHAADTTVVAPYRGKAFDYERNIDAYVEEHVEGYVQGRHVYTRTAFLAPDGKKLGDRDLEFARFPFKPDYLYRDLRNGYEEGAKVEASDILVHFKDSDKSPVKEKRIQVPEPCVINGGVGEFVRQRWDEIAAGKQVPFNMVIPARLDYYRFVAYVDKKYSLGDKDRGRPYLPVVIEPKNSMLAMLLPTIVMYEDSATKRLLRYQGIVNVADPKGRSLRVRIEYPDKGP